VTHFFPYDELTWPEVAALRRDTPLVIPLGTGYDRPRLAEALGDPAAVGLLPPIPYGFPGSSLETAAAPFAQMVSNLLDSLQDDGFSRVYALHPQGLELGFGPRGIAQWHASQLRESTARPGRGDESSPYGLLPHDNEREKCVLIPIGHTEQHGYHLPLSTDTLIIGAIGRGAAAAVPNLAVCLPPFPYGASTHRASFAGTLNVGGRAFEEFWLAVVDVLVQRGFRLHYLMSGHGGNCSFLVNVVKYAGERHRRIFCATAWLHTNGHIAGPVLSATRLSGRGGMGHAGELETAMILALRPDLTHMERVVDETEFVATESYYMDWIEGGALVANPPWDDDTATGAYGAGSLATAEHGRLWLDAAIAEKAAHVREIHEQQRRREERRVGGFGLWAGEQGSRGAGEER
jgi:creatinine amidohydrolase